MIPPLPQHAWQHSRALFIVMTGRCDWILVDRGWGGGQLNIPRESTVHAKPGSGCHGAWVLLMSHTALQMCFCTVRGMCPMALQAVPGSPRLAVTVSHVCRSPGMCAAVGGSAFSGCVPRHRPSPADADNLITSMSLPFGFYFGLSFECCFGPWCSVV